MTWWDSIERLKALNFYSNAVGGIAGIVTAVAVIGSLIFGARLSTLEEEDSERKENKSNEELAEAKHELAQLKERTSERQLSADQKEALHNLLAGEPRGKITVATWSSGGPEMYQYASQIRTAFGNEGYDVGKVVALYHGDPHSGIQLQIRDKDAAPEHTMSVAMALISLGFIKGIGINPHEDLRMLPADTVMIGVGAKESLTTDTKPAAK